MGTPDSPGSHFDFSLAQGDGLVVAAFKFHELPGKNLPPCHV